MTEKYFRYDNEDLVEVDKESLNVPSVGINMQHIDYANELYGRVGERFHVEWWPNAKAEPVIYTDTLENSSESDVLNALIDMKKDGLL